MKSSTLVIVEAQRKVAAVGVDEIDGVRQVVLKNIDGLLENEDYFLGGAVMGDGSIALVLNAERIVGGMHA